jgi:hypothetical protein
VDKTGDNQHELDKDYTEDASTSRSSVGGGFQRCGRQCADGHYRAILQYISTIVLGVGFELLVLAGPKKCHYNGQGLLLCFSLSNVPKLALVHPEKVSTPLFPEMVEF